MIRNAHQMTVRACIDLDGRLCLHDFIEMIIKTNKELFTNLAQSFFVCLSANLTHINNQFLFCEFLKLHHDKPLQLQPAIPTS